MPKREIPNYNNRKEFLKAVKQMRRNSVCWTIDDELICSISDTGELSTIFDHLFMEFHWTGTGPLPEAVDPVMDLGLHPENAERVLMACDNSGHQTLRKQILKMLCKP